MTKLKSTTLSLLLFMAFCASVLSNSAQAQSYGINQSYFLTDDGKMHTVKTYKANSGYVDLFSPQTIFILPEMIEEMDSSYIIDEDDRILTVDPDGFVYSFDYEEEVGSGVKHKGGSFFITRDNSIVFIMTNGDIKKVEAINEKLDSRVKVTGGNYIITRKGTVYIVNNVVGEVFEVNLEVDTDDIATKGNNFIITKDGLLVSFGVEIDGTNAVKTQKDPLFKNIKLKGGNFFFDRYYNIHTIGANAVVDGGILNRTIKVRNNELPSKIGNNYFMYDDGSFYSVDAFGVFNYIQNFSGRIITTTK